MNKSFQVAAMSCLFLATTRMNASAINIQIREGRPVVDGVYVNGHGPYRFLVDTGSTLNHLELRLAESIGLKASFHTQLQSSVGVTPASGSEGIEVTLGSVHADKQTFLFAGLDAVHETWPDIQGVLGQAFLSRFDYLLDMRRKQLEFGTHPLDGKGIQTPYQSVYGRVVVPTSLGRMVLDSGIHRVTRFGVKGAEAVFQMTTMSGTVQLGSVPSSMMIGGRVFWRGDAVAVPKTAETGADGLLPTSLFKSVYVSNSEGYVVFDE
jgi:hypothetical protein